MALAPRLIGEGHEGGRRRLPQLERHRRLGRRSVQGDARPVLSAEDPERTPNVGRVGPERRDDAGADGGARTRRPRAPSSTRVRLGRVEQEVTNKHAAQGSLRSGAYVGSPPLRSARRLARYADAVVQDYGRLAVKAGPTSVDDVAALKSTSQDCSRAEGFWTPFGS